MLMAVEAAYSISGIFVRDIETMKKNLGKKFFPENPVATLLNIFWLPDESKLYITF